MWTQAIYESPDEPGVLWIGSETHGLDRLDRATGVLTHNRHDPDDPSSISTDWVVVVQEDQFGALWIGTRGGGLNSYDRGTERFTSYKSDPGDPTSLTDDWVLSIHESRDGTLWIGPGSGGLLRFDRDKGTFLRHAVGPESSGGLSWGMIFDIQEGRDGTIWIGTDGLVAFDREREEFQVFEVEGRQATVLVVHEDQTGRIWAAVGNAGLHLLDANTGILEPIFTENEGLPHGNIHGIEEDEQGNLWIATERGLSKFSPETKSYRNYDTSDGLPDAWVGPSFRSSRGEMFFSAPNGFVTFYPSQVADNPHIPPVVLTDFQSSCG
jgi:ligand-binding sensor domain-containing protein